MTRDRERARLRGWRRRCPARLRPHDGKVLWTFQTGRQIAAGPTIFTADGKEYIAITVGGTPTSSGGGLASQLQVFALGGSKTESPKPPRRRRSEPPRVDGPRRRPTHRGCSHTFRRRGDDGRAQGADLDRRRRRTAHALEPVHARTSSTSAGGCVFGGSAVVGAAIAVDRYVLPRPTGSDGRFVAPVDSTLARRHPVTVVDASRATVGGRGAHRRASSARCGVPRAGSASAYALGGCHRERAERQRRRQRAARLRADGVRRPDRRPALVPAVGADHGRGRQPDPRRDRRDADERPRLLDVLGAVGRERPLQRVLPGLGQVGGNDPVEFAVQIAYGRTSYTTGARNPTFKRRRARRWTSASRPRASRRRCRRRRGARRDLPRPARRRLGPQRRRQAGLARPGPTRVDGSRSCFRRA